MRLLVFLLIMMLTLLAESSVLAEDRVAEALSEFTEGKRLFKAEEFSGAADCFRRANELNPNWKLQYNIGQSEAAARRYGLSLEAFELYLAQGGDEVEAERQSQVLAEIARLRELVGFLRVEAPKGARVSVDGVERGTSPIHRELPVAASVSHLVTATQVGQSFSEETIQVSGGREVSVELVAEASVEPVATVEEDEEPISEPMNGDPTEEEGGERSSLRTWGWVTVGAGAALLVGGGITGGLALTAHGDAEEQCPDGCYASDYGLIDKRDNLALTTDILLGIGSVAAIAGVVMLIVDKKGKEQDGAEVAIVPAVGGFGLMGRF